MTAIPVFVGPRIIALCDAVSIRRYVGAPNAEVIRRRKTKEIVQVNLSSCGDDSMVRSTAGSPSPTYTEHLESHTLTTLKRYDDGTGQLVHWGLGDSFDPRRFNPDRLVMPRRPDCPDRRPCRQIATKPTDAPHVPPARFSVKRDPLQPWSAENSRDVF